MWKKIASKTVFSHPRLTVIEDTVELPSGDQVPYLLFGSSKPAAAVICVRDNKILLAKEYSYPPNEVLFQFPGGAIEKGEEPIEAAKRELAEEVGLSAETVEPIGWFYTNNRRSDQKMHIFVANGCSDTTKQGGDKEEDITSQWVPIEEVERMIRDGLIVNYSLLAAWALFCSSSHSFQAK